MSEASRGDVKVVVIGSWDDPLSRSIRLQDFKSGDDSFIPIFSDLAAFLRQVKGTGFESQGLEIDRALLASVLRGDERLVLNPGDPRPVTLTKSSLASFAGQKLPGTGGTDGE